jgi:hypothetical protein
MLTAIYLLSGKQSRCLKIQFFLPEQLPGHFKSLARGGEKGEIMI